jgi:hypothetical protein
MGLFQKGSKPDKSKIKREKFVLGPEHGESTFVYVRGLTVPEGERHVEHLKTLQNPSIPESDRKNAGYFLMSCCLVDENGTQLFDDPVDVEANFDVSASDFVKIMTVMNRLSGLDRDFSKN